MSVTFQKLTSFPRNRLIEEELIRCRAQELDLIGSFGTAETVVSGDDLVFYWDLEWGCGLVMGLQFNQLTEVLTVHLDAPETEHALRHLGFEVRDVWSLEKDVPPLFARLDGADDRAWELWRRHDDGNQELVRVGLSRRDAACRQLELAVSGIDHAYSIAGPQRA